MGVKSFFSENISVKDFNKQTTAFITEVDTKHGHHYAYRYIKYTYKVKNVRYTSEDRIPFSDETKRVGMKITINYKESDPSESHADLKYLLKIRIMLGILYVYLILAFVVTPVLTIIYFIILAITE